MLLVIFGAGASYDSRLEKPLPEVPPPPPVGDYRPPLATQLFEGRQNFLDVVDQFPEVAPLLQPMQRAVLQGVPIERRLAELQDRTPEDFALERQLRAFRFYLQHSLYGCSMKWPASRESATNYGDLLWEICRWQRDTGEPAIYVSFNYDTLLDKACVQNYDFSHDASLDGYVASESFKLVKLHGSVLWSRVVRLPLDKTELRGDDLRLWMIRSMESDAITDEYVGIGHPMQELVSGDAPPNVRGCFPAIAIPVDKKQAFECPSHHIEQLKQALPHVRKILVIGWRGTEDAFLELLGQHVPSRPRVHIVCGHEAESTSANLRLSFLEPQWLEDTASLGFSDYLRDELIHQLLRA